MTEPTLILENNPAAKPVISRDYSPSQITVGAPIVSRDYWQKQEILTLPVGEFTASKPVVSESIFENISVGKPIVSEDITINKPVVSEDIIVGKPIVSRDYGAENVNAPKPIISRDYGAGQVGVPSIESAFGEIKPIVYRDYWADSLGLPLSLGRGDFFIDTDYFEQNFLADLLVLDAALLSETPTSVVFVDTSVAGYQTILDTLDPDTEIVLIDPNVDGIEFMAAWLSARTNIEAIHIISHGGAGNLTLGNGALNSASINGQYADELAVIGAALSASGDILIYGCDFGVDVDAVNALALATGADIAASSDDTGSASAGGDWDLEVKSGDIEAQAIVATAFGGLLIDTDGDGIDDSVDLDDDNDGISDVSEMVLTAGYGRRF